ncbi:hypothetical protein ABZ351_36440, partial [Streptomyces microflavus]|uniref:hypothetical protein n=1 Tax=Streptomyces microflavus TaxID=1919 RepID=UPI0033FA9644
MRSPPHSWRPAGQPERSVADGSVARPAVHRRSEPVASPSASATSRTEIFAAAAAKIPVISYDRLLLGNKNVDFYVSF